MNAKLSSNAFRRVLGSKVVTELEPAGVYYVVRCPSFPAFLGIDSVGITWR